MQGVLLACSEEEALPGSVSVFTYTLHEFIPHMKKSFRQKLPFSQIPGIPFYRKIGFLEYSKIL
jgi:hypothetical protein